MIYVIATVEIAEGRGSEYLAELKKILPLVRAEKGCLDYSPTADIPTDLPVQDPINKNTVTLIEQWTDIDALKVHLTVPHMQSYRAAVKDCVKRVTIRILGPV